LISTLGLSGIIAYDPGEFTFTALAGRPCAKSARRSPCSPIFRFDTFHLPPYFVPMPATLEALSNDALVLPPEQRIALAYRLLVSVEPDPEPGADAAWEAEIARRIARFDAGESQAVPAAEVFAGLRKIAPD